MRSLVFEGDTWAVYEELREKDKKLHKALCKLLKDMLRSDPSNGLGKPEQLRHSLKGFWSKSTVQGHPPFTVQGHPPLARENTVHIC